MHPIKSIRSSVSDAVASTYSSSGASFQEQSHSPDNSMNCTYENAFVPYIMARYRDKRSNAISVSSCWIGGQWTLVQATESALVYDKFYLKRKKRKKKSLPFSHNNCCLICSNIRMQLKWCGCSMRLARFQTFEHALRCAWQRQRLDRNVDGIKMA